LSSSRGN